jgi:hypothetical protein
LLISRPSAIHGQIGDSTHPQLNRSAGPAAAVNSAVRIALLSRSVSNIQGFL